MSLTPERISVKTADDTGGLYAAVSLLQMRVIYSGFRPRGRIEDAPHFGWRGMHLDFTRHFFLHRRSDA